MPRSIHHLYKKHRILGKEFIKMWNESYMDGVQKKIAERFKISIPTIYRIRKELGLKDLHNPEHPGNIKMRQRIKGMYHQGLGTEFIGKVMGMCSQNVQKILHKEGVEMRPQHITNPIFYKTRSDINPLKLPKMIKKLYLKDKLTQQKIAGKLHINPSTVSTKLKAMGLKIRSNNHQLMKGGYPCQWCGKIMKKVWQNKGLRKQRYCSNTNCSENAKDYRRMKKHTERYSKVRMDKMENTLKETWGKDYEKAKMRILNANPVSKERTDRFDSQILILFKKGMEFNEIAKEIGADSPNFVQTRLSKYILVDYVFRIKYHSRLTGRWKVLRVAEDFTEVKKRKRKLIKRLGYVPELRITPISTRAGRMSLKKQMNGSYNKQEVMCYEENNRC